MYYFKGGLPLDVQNTYRGSDAYALNRPLHTLLSNGATARKDF
ncbi:hypothetical protein K661_02692 [Piscirickettsia salmonis LF-89 = ATCC VR-1361]|nr:hypothetical protein K661_02692 [Piscirickettsia salmonis LF-89 = ATCC VR-1361]